ncbi:Transposase IS4 [Popillia japonica]|uniref:Transposase IS4 n=1 Tax=Popillia japonica TaxID=7064 RepID=A0AAW1JCP3_POPJA
MSDSDENYSETDEEENILEVRFGNWSILADPFADKLPRPLQDFTADYDFHPGIDFKESKKYNYSVWTSRAEMYFQQKNTTTVFGLQWKQLEKEELYVFIALDFLTGLVKCPRISDYWSGNILCGGPEVFDKSVMSRNRYLSILKFLRFSPLEAARPRVPMTRLGVFISMLKNNCMTLVDPGPVFAIDEHLMLYKGKLHLLKNNCMTLVDPGPVFAIDEHLMLYKGKLHFRRYIKSKTSQFRIKIFALCPSNPELRGYTWNFCLYVGKDTFDV